METEKLKNVENHFEAGSNCQVFNGPVCGCVFAMPGATVHHSAVQQVDARQESKLTLSEQEVMEALRTIQKDRDADGRYLMHDSDQWYAVFRVLSSQCGYPTKASVFAQTMKNLGADSLRLPCVYENFRKVAVNDLPQNPLLWYQHKNTANPYLLKQVSVGLRLMELLHLG